jgi:hypothetical protein
MVLASGPSAYRLHERAATSVVPITLDRAPARHEPIENNREQPVRGRVPRSFCPHWAVSSHDEQPLGGWYTAWSVEDARPAPVDLIPGHDLPDLGADEVAESAS